MIIIDVGASMYSLAYHYQITAPYKIDLTFSLKKIKSLQNVEKCEGEEWITIHNSSTVNKSSSRILPIALSFWLCVMLVIVLSNEPAMLNLIFSKFVQYGVCNMTNLSFLDLKLS